MDSKKAGIGVILLVIILAGGIILVEDRPPAEIEVTFEHPENVQVDKPFDISIDGLPKGGSIDLIISTTDDNGRTWRSERDFFSEDGSLKIPADETMRIIQMMKPVKEGVTDSYSPPAGLGEKWELAISVKHNGETFGTTGVTRTLGDPNVKSFTVENDEIVGKVFEPPGDDPAPGVVVLHGSGGELTVGQAYMLASNGYVALAIKYFGPENQIPPRLSEVPIEYVEKSGKWLLNHERVEGDQVGLVGWSRGGELALLAASHFDIFGAVGAISPSGVVWEGFEADDYFPTGTFSWTYRNEPVPYVPVSLTDLVDVYKSSLKAASDETVENATIPVENIEGPILAVSGGDDALWISAELTEIAMDRLDEDNFAYEYKHIVYENAGHAISIPYLPTANHKIIERFHLGGTAEGKARADSDYWPRLLETLESLSED